MRILGALALLAVAAFSTFGLLASFEPVANALVWRIGYGAALVASVVGIVVLLGRRP